VAQTRARVFKGDTHYPDKLLSLFEPLRVNTRNPTYGEKHHDCLDTASRFIKGNTNDIRRRSPLPWWPPRPPSP
jgi:hypothetical protein